MRLIQGEKNIQKSLRGCVYISFKQAGIVRVACRWSTYHAVSPESYAAVALAWSLGFTVTSSSAFYFTYLFILHLNQFIYLFILQHFQQFDKKKKSMLNSLGGFIQNGGTSLAPGILVLLYFKFCIPVSEVTLESFYLFCGQNLKVGAVLSRSWNSLKDAGSGWVRGRESPPRFIHAFI